MKLTRKASISIPAHPDESRDPGLTSNLVPLCSFKSAPAAQPFLDPDFRLGFDASRRTRGRQPARTLTRIIAAAAIILSPLPLAACGFTPVYGGQSGAAFANSGPISINEIRAISSSRSAPGRTGHFLRQELVRTVGQGVPGFASGTLDVKLEQEIRRLAFAPDQAASRSDYIGAAVWTLYAPDGSILGTGEVEERASFNFGDAAYGDLAAQTAAQERLATLLARAIRAELIIAGGKAVDPKTGKPIVAKAEPATTPRP